MKDELLRFMFSCFWVVVKIVLTTQGVDGMMDTKISIISTV